MAIANAAVRYIFRHSADRLRMDLSNRNKQIWNMFIFVYFLEIYKISDTYSRYSLKSFLNRFIICYILNKNIKFSLLN